MPKVVNSNILPSGTLREPFGVLVETGLKLEHGKYQACTVSTYDFSTLYASLPHILIKSKLIHLNEMTFAREKKLFLVFNTKCAFFTNDTVEHYKIWTCHDVCK